MNKKGKIAIIGLSEIMKVTVDGIHRSSAINNARTFDTEEEAKDWLVI